MKSKFSALILAALIPCFVARAQKATHPDARHAKAELIQTRANGFRGIWYINQPSNDAYAYKYSGGLSGYSPPRTGSVGLRTSTAASGPTTLRLSKPSTLRK